MLVDHMGEGLSMEAFAGVAGVSKDTLYDWLKKYEDFRQAYKIGRAKNQLWWEKKGMDTKKPLAPAVYIFNMKNRFDWTDKRELGVSGNVKHEHQLKAPSKEDLIEAIKKDVFIDVTPKALTEAKDPMLDDEE